jgi:hypothetical protein
MAIPKAPDEQRSILDTEADINAAPETGAPEEEYVQVASLSSGITSKLARSKTKEIIGGLTTPGARLSPEARVTKEAGEMPTVTDVPVGPVIGAPGAAPQPQPKSPPPVTLEEMQARLQARQAEIGTAREVPSPSKAQKIAGLKEGPVNTRFYDSDEFAATVQAAAKAADEKLTDVKKPMSIDEIFTRAQDAGIPKENLDKIFSGQGMDASIGGAQLAERMAGLVVLHDISAGKVDDLMRLASRGELDEGGKLALREAMAQHDMILAELSGAKTDIARSMNVFKGASDRAGGLTQKELRDALNELGGDDQLVRLAEGWSKMSMAQRNAMLRNSVKRKSYEATVYMAQSVMLNDPVTHIYNAAGNALFGFLDVPERAMAVPFGMLRQRLAKTFGRKYDPDRYYGADIYARMSGFKNGLIDGWAMMGRKFAEGGAAKDAPRDPLRTEYWAGAAYKIPFTKEIREFPDLTNTVPGKVFNAMGVAYSIPFRALGAADEFFAGVAQRVQLHEEAARAGGKVFDNTLADLTSRGVDPRVAEKEATQIASRHVQKFLTEMPGDIDMSMNAWRKQVTLQADIDKQLPFAGIYNGANKMMNKWYFKPMAPFSKTLTNIANEANSRIGVLNFVSPAFYAELEKGGRHKDLAASRIFLGSAAVGLGYYLAGEGRITGAGPGDTSYRNMLKSQGWQPFSYRAGKSEVTSEQVKQLKRLLGEDAVTEGSGADYGDSVFVSLKRLEPFNMPFIFGAALTDVARYSDYDEEGLWEKLFYAGSAAVAETATNMPAMQGISELTSIAGYKQTDAGDRIVSVFNALGKRYSSFLLSGTPIVGFSNSTLTSRIERMIDPTVSNVGAGEDTHPGLVFAEEAYNRWKSRVPIWSDTVPVKLNDFGEPIGLNAASAVQPLSMTYGETNNVREFMDAIHMGPSPFPKKIEGLKVPPDIEARWKLLANKEILIDGMTLEENIEATMTEFMDDVEATGEELAVGDMRNLIKSIQNNYRKLAKLRLFGEVVENPEDPRKVDQYLQMPVDLSDNGLDDAQVEFPEFAAKLAEIKNKKRFPVLTQPTKKEAPSLTNMIK